MKTASRNGPHGAELVHDEEGGFVSVRFDLD